MKGYKWSKMVCNCRKMTTTHGNKGNKRKKMTNMQKGY
jgi:hypothetical protein